MALNDIRILQLPAGWYIAARQTVGSGLSIVSAFEQAI